MKRKWKMAARVCNYAVQANLQLQWKALCKFLCFNLWCTYKSAPYITRVELWTFAQPLTWSEFWFQVFQFHKCLSASYQWNCTVRTLILMPVIILEMWMKYPHPNVPNFGYGFLDGLRQGRLQKRGPLICKPFSLWPYSTEQNCMPSSIEISGVWWENNIPLKMLSVRGPVLTTNMTLNIASCNTNVPISINPADLYLQRPPSNHRNELKLCNMSMNDFPYGVFSNPWGCAPESTCIWAWTPLSQTLLIQWNWPVDLHLIWALLFSSVWWQIATINFK